MKYLLALLTAALLTLPAAAQTPAPTPDPLPGLLQERERLMRQYDEANAQRNAFLANKPSKKDLQEVIDALKGIIRKDTEIVRALKETELRRTAGIVAEKREVEQQATVAKSDQSSTRQRFYDLENQIQNLQLREKQHLQKLREAEAAAQEAEESRTTPQLLALALAGLCAGLLLYVLRLRRQLTTAPARRKARR